MCHQGKASADLRGRNVTFPAAPVQRGCTAFKLSCWMRHWKKKTVTEIARDSQMDKRKEWSDGCVTRPVEMDRILKSGVQGLVPVGIPRASKYLEKSVIFDTGGTSYIKNRTNLMVDCQLRFR